MNYRSINAVVEMVIGIQSLYIIYSSFIVLKEKLSSSPTLILINKTFFVVDYTWPVTHELRINSILILVIFCKNKRLISLNSRHLIGLPQMKTLFSHSAITYIIADYQDSPTNLSFCTLSIIRFAMSKKFSISLKCQVLK